jgi:hypothetical protein
LYLSILCSLRSRSFELADQASLRIWLAHLSHGASTMILRFTSLIASSSATCLFTRLETSSPFAAALVMLRSISSWRSAQQLGVSYCFSCSADYVSASIACSIAPRGMLNNPLTDRAGGSARPGFPCFLGRSRSLSSAINASNLSRFGSGRTHCGIKNRDGRDPRAINER